MSKAKLRIIVLGFLVLLAVGISLISTSKESDTDVEVGNICILESVNQSIDEVEISLTTEVPVD